MPCPLFRQLLYSANNDLNHRLTNASTTRNSDDAVMFQTQPSYGSVGNVVGVSTTWQAGTDKQAFRHDEQNRLIWPRSANGSITCGCTLTAGTFSAS